MSSDSAYPLAIVCEGPSDFRTISLLVDHVLCSRVDWIEHDQLDVYREWIGEDGGNPEVVFYKWATVGNRAKEARYTKSIHGYFDEMPGDPDALTARRILVYLKAIAAKQGIEGVIIVRDTDGYATGRASGLRQARDSSPVGWPFAVAVGVAHPCREGWLLCLYKPRNSREEQLLDEERRTLKFDPTMEPHRLLAKADGDPRNPKRDLSALTCDNHERESQCVEGWSVEEIKNLGQATLLSDFIREIEQHLIPLFAGHRP